MELVEQLGGDQAVGAFEPFLEEMDPRGELNQPDAPGGALEGVEAAAQLPEGGLMAGTSVQAEDERLDPLEEVDRLGEESLAAIGVDLQCRRRGGGRPP